VAQRVFNSMMRIMQPPNRGLACRIPCCPVVWWQSRLLSALAVIVRVAHEYKHAIQPCNVYCIVVTSWHCVLHHKLAIKAEDSGDVSAFVNATLHNLTFIYLMPLCLVCGYRRDVHCTVLNLTVYLQCMFVLLGADSESPVFCWRSKSF